MLIALASFLVAATVVVLLPGPDSLVVVRGLVRDGRRGGVLTAAGVMCGLLVWVSAAALGLSALLRASEVGYTTLKLVGAAYLLWIGVQSLRSLRSGRLGEQVVTDHGPGLGRSGFVAGFLTDVLNPKVGVFFVSFLPGFVPQGYSVGWTTLGLGAVYAALTAVYFAGLVVAAGSVSTWMATPHIRRRLDAATGMVLVAFGVRLATEL
ncbi:MAG: LysE family translocator [Marmoricola sp.]